MSVCVCIYIYIYKMRDTSTEQVENIYFHMDRIFIYMYKEIT